jgi:hypothetical protein
MRKIYLSIIGSLLLHLATHAQWALTGNPISSGQFLGTTNAQNLVFKANSYRVGMIDVSSNNTGLGTWTLGYPNMEGSQNSAFGNNALANITSAAYANTAVGYLSLTAANNSGNTNTGIGEETLYANTSGYSNTAGGALAMYHNTTGYDNNALGGNALQQATTENYNNIMGCYAAYSTNTNGTDLCAIGHQALYSNTGGGVNVAIGLDADYMSTSAVDNIAIGSFSMYENINTIADKGSLNVAIGGYSLYYMGDGFWNTVVGYNSTQMSAYSADYDINTVSSFGAWTSPHLAPATGGINTAGAYALYNSGSTTNGGLTAIGYDALNYNITGYENVAIGAGAGPGSGYTDLTNATAIGYSALNFASNQVVVGNTAVTQIGGYATGGTNGWTTFPCDVRFKKNIQENVPGLNYIRQLRPVTYNLDVTGLNNSLKPSPRTAQPSESGRVSIQQKEKIAYSGFIAQEVETVDKNLGFDFSAVNKPANGKGFYMLSYEAFVVPLVKTVQEMSKANDALERTISGLQSQINGLKQQITLLTK